MAMQQIYLPLLYKRYAGKPVEKGLVIFADAHHEELPFSMKKMYETLQWDPEYKNETWVTDFGKQSVKVAEAVYEAVCSRRICIYL